jgi:hypothetical protein
MPGTKSPVLSTLPIRVRGISQAIDSIQGTITSPERSGGKTSLTGRASSSAARSISATRAEFLTP